MGVAQAHDAGWTGAGVKVAVIDGQINPDSPGLAGANLTVVDAFLCSGTTAVTTDAAYGPLHGTHVSQVLVRPDGANGGVGGIAPNIELTFYALGQPNCQDPYVDGKNGMGRAIVAATDAGNDIISISMGAETGTGQYEALAYALAHDVMVVSSSPNTDEDIGLVFPMLANGVVSVAAVSDSLDLMSDNGKPVVTEEVTLVAPGIDVRVIGTDGDVTADGITRGTSFAAPLVSGALALAKEKYPEATGNQLIQALISTTVSAQNGVPRDTVGGYGYGVVSLQGLLSSEPLSLPDENPLMDKSWGEPTQAQIDAQRDGEGDATPTPSPEPKASEEPKPKPKPTSTASSSEPSTPDAPVPWPLIAGGGFAALGVAVIIISVMRFRRGAGQS
ncbi:S8 family serine peptidase [Microbacterium sp. NC79]|uniref:S8 family peptidase n=1 Tax=Microbacterium sp. NC79 TaxID=2851009 RepID=UPI001C2B8D14|nr:S8 family serine peptidase [Microbacterium sp. NC79]MBV0894049.1 S8 family serine peptidase [Microbacterium sp. NC79]